MKALSSITTILLTGLLFTACKKDYYTDTGRHDGHFNGNVWEFLQSRPGYFDSLTKIIRLAGLEDALKNEAVTFFAPADSSINRTIQEVNLRLKLLGRPEVRRLEQIKPEVWRKQLSRYLFKGKKSMNDYPQLDPANISAYPGQIYASYDGLFMNIGVVYDDAGSVRYAGYRHLKISYIPSPTTPRDYTSWFSADIATVNIEPANGYVHVIKYALHYFGFEPGRFFEEAMAEGIDP